MKRVLHFAIYNAATGEVKRVGSGTGRIRALEKTRLEPGQALYPGQVDPKTTYLPGGVPTPKPAEPVIVKVSEVKAFAGRLLSYTDWVVVKALDTGEPANPGILAYRQAVRAASNEIEAMDPIPADYRDPKYWPTAP